VRRDPSANRSIINVIHAETQKIHKRLLNARRPISYALKESDVTYVEKTTKYRLHGHMERMQRSSLAPITFNYVTEWAIFTDKSATGEQHIGNEHKV